MVRLIVLCSLLVASSLRAQTVEPLSQLTGREISVSSLASAAEQWADHSVADLPKWFSDGYIAMVDPDYFDTPMNQSHIARFWARGFILGGNQVDRRALEQAWLQAFDRYLDHETILMAVLHRSFIGGNCFGIFWASEQSYGHPFDEATHQQQLTLLTLAISAHYNARDSDLPLLYGPNHLTTPGNLDSQFQLVVNALATKGVITEDAAEQAIQSGAAHDAPTCQTTSHHDRHPNDLTTAELARRAIVPYRTSLTSYALTLDAFIPTLGTTFEGMQADDSPLIRAFIDHIWPITPALHDLYASPDALMADWRNALDHPFVIAPMLMETYPMGLGCTGPSALIAANWETAPDEINVNQQAVIAALLSADDPDALIADFAALTSARNSHLQRELDLGRGDPAQFQTAMVADLPPLSQSCSE